MKKINLMQLIVVLLLFIPSFFLIKNLISKTNEVEIIPEATVVSKPVTAPRSGAFLGVSLYDQNYKTLVDIEEKVNKHFALVGVYQAWGDPKNKFNSDWARSIASHRSIPFITWEPWKPISGYDRSESKVYQPEFALKNITNHDFDSYIVSYATAVKKFGKPVMIRFAHEMNGNWYSWGSTFNTPDEYIAAWRHVHDIFVKEGATNATWVWSPNEIYTDPRTPYADDILRFYPGDEYVDWVGFSSFNWANQYKHNVWKDPEDMYAQTLSVLKQLNKPIMITETASADGATPEMKANWIKALAHYINNNPVIKGILWFDIADNGINWSIDSTPLSQKAFEEEFNNYFIYYYTAQN